MDWGSVILGGIQGGLKPIHANMAKDADDERERLKEIEKEKRAVDRDRINREALFADFKAKKEWETAFNIQSAPAMGKAAGAQAQAQYDASGDMRAKQTEDELAKSLKSAQQTKDVELGSFADPRYISEAQRREAAAIRQANAGRQPQQATSGSIIQDAIARVDNAKTPEEKAAAMERLNMVKGATGHADKPDQRERWFPRTEMAADGMTKVTRMYNGFGQSRDATKEDAAGDAGSVDPIEKAIADRKAAAAAQQAPVAPAAAPIVAPAMQAQPRPVAPPAPQAAPPQAPQSNLPVGQGVPPPQAVEAYKAQLQQLRQEIATLGRSGNSPRLQEATAAAATIVKALQAWGISA